MAFNHQALKKILDARSLTQRELADRLEVDGDTLVEELDRLPLPRQQFLAQLSAELAVPAFVFFMKEAPSFDKILPDFRSAHPKPVAKSRETIESIEIASAIQKLCADLEVERAERFPELGDSSYNMSESAARVRKFFGITLKDQELSADVRRFYIICRKKIEDKGIFVLHDSFPSEDGSGFCLYHSRYPIIVINTRNQSQGRRLFTLIHELAHILLHQSGISDPFIEENAIERRCNRFAGEFLSPRDFVSELLRDVQLPKFPSTDDVKRVARRLKISHEASVLRLEQLGIFAEGSHQRWRRLIGNSVNPDSGDKGGGRSAPDQEKVKLAKFGFRFAKIFESSLAREQISPLNLYRITGLKPTYQLSYFNYANSLTARSLLSVELSDE